MPFSVIVFFLALLGIAALFVIKFWELRRGRVLFHSWRERADVRALQLKELMDAARVDLAKVPPEVVRLSRFGIHRVALGFAAFARNSEYYAHRVADLVSYRHHFEKRATQSEFLKKVAEHKNGNGLDTTEDNGHNT